MRLSTCWYNWLTLAWIRCGNFPPCKTITTVSCFVRFCHIAKSDYCIRELHLGKFLRYARSSVIRLTGAKVGTTSYERGLTARRDAYGVKIYLTVDWREVAFNFIMLR